MCTEDTGRARTADRWRGRVRSTGKMTERNSKKYYIPTGIGTLDAFAVHCLKPFRPPALRRLQHWNGRYITRTWQKICDVKYKWQIQMWTWI
jgi:hypothetical protein